MKIIIKNKYIRFILLVIVIGFLLGIIYYLLLNNNTKNNIIESISNINNFKYNFILKDLIIMSLLLVLSFILVILPFGLFYILYESFSIGFIISIFIEKYSFNGLLYILIYIIIYKLITLLLKICYIKKLINMSKYIFKLIINKKDELSKDRLVINLRKSLYIFVIVFVINIILYLISPYLFSKISYLLK